MNESVKIVSSGEQLLAEARSALCEMVIRLGQIAMAEDAPGLGNR